jgi:hypothetical protein
MSKIPFILCQLAAFDFLNNCTSKDTFEIYLLEWEIPLDNESLTHAKRISEKIKHESSLNWRFVWRYSGSRNVKTS